jgi:signal transduction histidine kinase
MIERPKQAAPGAADRDPAAALAGFEGAAWVIDWVAAEVVAATAAGSARLPASAPGRRASLDAAMPGFARLRQMAGSGKLREPLDEHLILWTAQGAETLHCRIAPVPGDRSGRLLLVAAQPPPAPQVETEEAGASAPRPRSDFETLQAIARQIREGRLPPAPEPARPTAPPAVADPDAEAPTPPASAPEPRDDPTAGAQARRQAEARLAHELKTPLSAIAVAAEMMREERLGRMGNERYREYADDIHQNARHALEVVQRMLGLETGNDEALPEQSFAEVDLNAIAAGCAKGLEPLASRAGLTLALALQPRLPHVIADETSVRQMLINLLTNALKFTPPGGRVTIATAYQGRAPLELIVTDDGIGMAPAEIARVMGEGPADEFLPRAGGGRGIGLPLVRRLAAANGASLHLASEPRAGTRAAIAFPSARIVPV